MPNWWTVAALWVVGAAALLAATVPLLPRMGARPALRRSAVLAVVGLLCVVVAGYGIQSAPVLSAPAAAE